MVDTDDIKTEFRYEDDPGDAMCLEIIQRPAYATGGIMKEIKPIADPDTGVFKCALRCDFSGCNEIHDWCSYYHDIKLETCGKVCEPSVGRMMALLHRVIKDPYNDEFWRDDIEAFLGVGVQ